MNDRSDADTAPPRTRLKPVDPRLLRYARASRFFFAAVAVIAAGQAAAIVAFAWLVTRAITGVIDGVPVADLTATLALLAAVVAARALLLWVRELVAARAAARVQTELRTHLVDAIGELGPEWLGQRSTASLAVTAGRGLDALEAYFGRYLPQLVQTVVVTPLILLVMWWEDWISGLTVLLTLPLIPLFMVLIGLATRAVQQKQWKTLQHLAARFSDTVHGLSTLKVYGRQHRAADSIAAVTERYRRETMKVLRVSFLSGFALEFLASISVAIVAVSIGLRLVDGSLALAVGLFVLLLAPEAYLPLRQVGVQFHAAAEGVAATEDVFEVLDAARTRARAALGGHAASSAPQTGRIDEASPQATGRTGLVLEGLAVHRGARVLEPVDLTCTPGTVTLVEGPSGAGKSSILAVLRGAAGHDGTATWNGRDVFELAPGDWLAWAGQQPGLIAGTVGANVALGDDRPDHDAVARALTLACADGIEPGLELGVQGAGLSGGQAQRVAVARAFYRHLTGRAGLIALDEPSSALDAATEGRLWRSVRELADGGAAVLIVSHRETARTIADAVVRVGEREVAA